MFRRRSQPAHLPAYVNEFTQTLEDNRRTLRRAPRWHRTFGALAVAAGIGFGIGHNAKGNVALEELFVGSAVGMVATPVAAAAQRRLNTMAARDRIIDLRPELWESLHNDRARAVRNEFREAGTTSNRDSVRRLNVKAHAATNFVTTALDGIGAALLTSGIEGSTLPLMHSTTAELIGGAAALAVGVTHHAFEGHVNESRITTVAYAANDAQRVRNHYYNLVQAHQNWHPQVEAPRTAEWGWQG